MRGAPPTPAELKATEKYLARRGVKVAPPNLHDIRAERSRRSYRYFIRAAWHVVEPATPLIEGYFIDAIADHLTWLYEQAFRSLIINIAPRHSKSTLASVMFPAWVWLRDPGFKFLTSSYAYSLAVRDANATRRLINSPWYQGVNRRPDGSPIFRLVDRADPELKRLKDLESFYQNDAMGHRRAVGVGGAATGEGGDLVSVDDPTNPQQAASDAERGRANEWWDQTMSNRGNDPKTFRQLIIMQRLHTRDLTGHVLAKDLGYVHLFLPERFNPKRICVVRGLGGEELYRDPRTEAGELLWRERFGPVEVEKLAIAMGDAASGQLDQDPLPPGGLIFKGDWIRRWTHLPAKFDRIILSWDMNAGEETTDGSFVVGQVWGVLGPDVYLLDQFRERCDQDASEDALKAQRERWKPSAIWIEDKSAGRTLISRMRKAVPGVIGLTPVGDKVTRAKAVTGYWRAGNVYLPLDAMAAWVPKAVEEIQNFPRHATDDVVDAMTQFLAELNGLNEKQQDAEESPEEVVARFEAMT